PIGAGHMQTGAGNEPPRALHAVADLQLLTVARAPARQAYGNRVTLHPRLLDDMALALFLPTSKRHLTCCSPTGYPRSSIACTSAATPVCVAASAGLGLPLSGCSWKTATCYRRSFRRSPPIRLLASPWEPCNRKAWPRWSTTSPKIRTIRIRT